MKTNERFFLSRDLPFIEARKSVNSGRHFKKHVHRRLSIGAIDQGEVIFHVAGKQATLGPGALALINPDTLHACNPKGRHKRSYFMLYLDVSWCGDIQSQLFQTKGFLPVQTILLAHERLYRAYRLLMEDLLAGRIDNDAIEQLVSAILLRTCTPSPEEPTVSLQIENLKKELTADLRHPLPLETLAKRHGINPYTLLRRFRKACSITPHAFRLNRQISRARELLRSGLDPATVAVECGFYDQSHMHRHFKAMTTVTPGEYQQNFY